ncbi:MAG: FUSC family protein, partial [Pantoea sp.]|nr:FUSC family protein [Pantoea sp.]
DLLGFVKAVERNASSLLMRQHFIMRMLDRVNIILPRKRLDPDAELSAAGDLIAETWIGANCYDFYARYHSELQQHQIHSAQMFHELSLYLRRKMRQLATQPHSELLDELNNLLKKLEKVAITHPETFAAMVHLFNIRVSLYPHQRWL